MENPYRIDWPAIERAFPPGRRPPALLADFATWLAGRAWGGVGCFELAGSWSDDAPMIDGTSLRRELALFLWLPDGSVVGFCYATDCSEGNAPVVGIGSEGQVEVLAASLEGLLAKIALRRFPSGAWSDLEPHEDAQDATGELADWLRTRPGCNGLASLAAASCSAPDAATFIQNFREARENHWRTHPYMKQLAALLREDLPSQSPLPLKNAETLDFLKGLFSPQEIAQYAGQLQGLELPAESHLWHATHFEARIVGNQFELLVLDRGFRPAAKATEAEPLLRTLREEQWRADPDLGLWTHMYFSIDARGTVAPRFDYMRRPEIGGMPVDAEQARYDLVRAPRPRRWVPAWMNTC